MRGDSYNDVVRSSRFLLSHQICGSPPEYDEKIEHRILAESETYPLWDILDSRASSSLLLTFNCHCVADWNRDWSTDCANPFVCKTQV